MATIGTFSLYKGAYEGNIQTLALNVKAQIVKVDQAEGRSPTHKVLVGQYQVGAGWIRQTRDGGREYISVKLDDPSFAAPIFANLVEQGDIHALIWTREPPSTPRSDPARE